MARKTNNLASILNGMQNVPPVEKSETLQDHVGMRSSNFSARNDFLCVYARKSKSQQRECGQ